MKNSFQLSDETDREDKEKVERPVFTGVGWESHLVDILERDVLTRNLHVPWKDIAGLHEAKALLQEAVVLPLLMPEFFRVLNFICTIQNLTEILTL